MEFLYNNGAVIEWYCINMFEAQFENCINELNVYPFHVIRLDWKLQRPSSYANKFTKHMESLTIGHWKSVISIETFHSTLNKFATFKDIFVFFFHCCCCCFIHLRNEHRLDFLRGVYNSFSDMAKRARFVMIQRIYSFRIDWTRTNLKYIQ